MYRFKAHIPPPPHPSAGRVGQGDVGRWTGGRGEPIVGRRPVKEQLLLWRQAVSVAHRDTQSCRAARCLCPAPRARLCGGGRRVNPAPYPARAPQGVFTLGLSRRGVRCKSFKAIACKVISCRHISLIHLSSSVTKLAILLDGLLRGKTLFMWQAPLL